MREPMMSPLASFHSLLLHTNLPTLLGSSVIGIASLALGWHRLRRRKHCYIEPAHCAVIPGEPLWGQDKWLGGESSPCGKFIYGVPGTAPRVLRITVKTREVCCIGPSYPGKFKWLRAVVARDGCIYCLPINAKKVLKIDPQTHDVTTIGPNFEGDWKWHGIYGIPANAEAVLKIDPATQEVSTIGPSFKGRQKWYGGLKSAADGAIYGIPQRASSVIRICPRTQQVTTITTPGGLAEGGWKWHGGVLDRERSTIFGIPSNADCVLKIHTSETASPTVTTIGVPLPPGSTGRHRTDGRYRYLGGALGRDNNVYLFPCDAERVLRIYTSTDEVVTVGPDFPGENKWQNGFACEDGAVYAIPQRATGALRILPPLASAQDGEEPEVSILDCDSVIGQYGSSTGDKFEGAVKGCDGSVYCIPLRAKHIIKIVPARMAT